MTRMMRLSTEERASMGTDARRRVVAQFSLDAVLDRWEDLYRELLESHPRPAHWAT
jgi:glycosyltransferase involved in cell wall biosynthesis